MHVRLSAMSVYIFRHITPISGDGITYWKHCMHLVSIMWAFCWAFYYSYAGHMLRTPARHWLYALMHSERGGHPHPSDKRTPDRHAIYSYSPKLPVAAAPWWHRLVENDETTMRTRCANSRQKEHVTHKIQTANPSTVTQPLQTPSGQLLQSFITHPHL